MADVARHAGRTVGIMDQRRIYRAIKRSWIFIAACTLVAGSIGAVWGFQSKAEFRATAQVFVSTGAASSLTDLTQGGTYAQQVVASYAQVAVSPYVLSRVIAQLGLPDSPAELATRVTADAPPSTAILNISAISTSPPVAADIANATAGQLGVAVQQLSSDGSQGILRVTQISQAVPPEARQGTNPLIVTFIGLLIGLLIGVAVVLIRTMLDQRIRTADDLRAVAMSPILAQVPYGPTVRAQRIVMQTADGGPQAEAVRMLRTSLDYVGLDSARRTVLITSSIQGEGKSTVAVNLAVACAEAGQRTVLVDGDLRRPAVAEYLGIDGSVGLTDYLVGRVSLEEARQEWGDRGLRVIPAGAIPPNPSELLQSRRMGDALLELGREADVVIVDAAPVLPVTDAIVVSRYADGLVVVAGANVVKEGQLTASVELLRQADLPLLGVALNFADVREQRYYGGAYRYGAEPARDRLTDPHRPSTSP